MTRILISGLLAGLSLLWAQTASAEWYQGWPLYFKSEEECPHQLYDIHTPSTADIYGPQKRFTSGPGVQLCVPEKGQPPQLPGAAGQGVDPH